VSTLRDPEHFRTVRQEVSEIWDRKAAWWDDYMEEGNDFQRKLIAPAQEKLLDLKKGEQVLEVACGNGNFARRMAHLGAHVTASDVSERFIDLARRRTTENPDMIDYRVIDATDSDQLMMLGEGRFDAAVCTMALFDMWTIEPLVTSLSRLLCTGGRFVFSIVHPCFNSLSATWVTETEDREGELVTTNSVKISGYIRPKARLARATGVKGEPEPHYGFDRPISLLFSTCFKAGFVLDGIEEPIFDEPHPGARPGSWQSYTEIPPVLVARMRLPG